jgi:hypothetical protein
MKKTRSLLGAMAMAALAACDNETPTRPPAAATPVPAPAPATSTTLVIPGAAFGSSQIAFVGAAPAPGSTLADCGHRIAGCAGRVRMTFSVRSSTSATVLGLRASLHSTEKIACLLGSSGPLTLVAGQPQTVEIVFDEADDCPTPVSITHMAAVVSGPSSVGSRQEWAVPYTFQP